MIWIRLYDSRRKPSHWTQIITGAQYAVFVFDVDSRTPRDLTGGEFIADHENLDPASVAICDSLGEAEGLANRITTQRPHLYCEIYDHEGKAKDPIRSVFHPEALAKHRGPLYARRQALIGVCFLSVGLTVASIDFYHHLRFIWGYILGLKCLVLGGTFMVRAFCEWYESRSGAEAG